MTLGVKLIDKNKAYAREIKRDILHFHETIADKVNVVMVTQRQFINRLLTGDTVCWTSPVLQKSSTPTKDILAPRKRRYIKIYSRFLMAILRKDIGNPWPVAPCASNSNSVPVLRP